MDSKIVILNYDQLNLQGFEKIFRRLNFDWTPEFAEELKLLLDASGAEGS